MCCSASYALAGDVGDSITVLGEILALVGSGDRSLDANFAAARQLRGAELREVIGRAAGRVQSKYRSGSRDVNEMHVPSSPYKGVYRIRRFSI